jgi:hypothetical protein
MVRLVWLDCFAMAAGQLSNPAGFAFYQHDHGEWRHSSGL